MATTAPLPTAAAVLVGWMVVAGAVAALWSQVTGDGIGGASSQAAGRLAATAALLALLAWSRSMRAAGVGTPGRWFGWVVGLVAVGYLVPSGLIGMFGPRGIGWLLEVPPAELRDVIGLQATVGIAEEVLFRGALLLILVLAWGQTRRAAFRAALVTAAIFALLHATSALAGENLAYVVANLVGTAVSGFWWAALTLACGSVWPAVVIHAASNAAVLAVPYAADALGPLRVAALEMPWVALGVWLLLDARRFARRSAVVEGAPAALPQEGR